MITFHPPLSVRRHWHAFHNGWATYIASALNQTLPTGYFAEPNVQYGIEIDVATFQEASSISEAQAVYSATGVQTSLEATWTPPPPVQTIPFDLMGDIVEVAIFSSEGGPTLVGAIELVSPANKDRASHRDVFISKCETYLRQGISILIVDVVTSRKENLHNLLMARLQKSDASPLDANLYAVAYRPYEADDQTQLAIWPETLAIGETLPILPLWLNDALCLPVDLGATYERTGQELKVT